ncbi:hypothetical protein PGB90_005056 [Kerria lacca]
MRHLARFPLMLAIMRPPLKVTLLALMTYMWAGSKASGTIARFPIRTIASLDYCPCGQAGTELVPVK